MNSPVIFVLVVSKPNSSGESGVSPKAKSVKKIQVWPLTQFFISVSFSWRVAGTTEIQGHHQVCRAEHGGLGTLSTTNWSKPWLCICWTVLHRSQIVKSRQNIIELGTRPEKIQCPHCSNLVVSKYVERHMQIIHKMNPQEISETLQQIADLQSVA